jgi:hypothetical protein
MKLTSFILIYLFLVLPTYAIDDQTNDNEDQGQYVDSGWDEEDKKEEGKGYSKEDTLDENDEEEEEEEESKESSQLEETDDQGQYVDSGWDEEDKKESNDNENE